MMVEIARFFASLATYDRRPRPLRHPRGRGPGRVPHRLPGRPRRGIDNNAYTNVMAAWVLLRALEALDLLPTAEPARADSRRSG